MVWWFQIKLFSSGQNYLILEIFQTLHRRRFQVLPQSFWVPTIILLHISMYFLHGNMYFQYFLSADFQVSMDVLSYPISSSSSMKKLQYTTTPHNKATGMKRRGRKGKLFLHKISIQNWDTFSKNSHDTSTYVYLLTKKASLYCWFILLTHTTYHNITY